MKLTKDFVYVVVIAILIALCGQFYYSFRYKPNHEIRVYYNQDIQANRKIVEAIQDADHYAYFAVYTFTRADIKDALLGAKHRGLDVRGVTDRSQVAQVESQRKIIEELKSAGIPVVTQDHTGIMHLKVLVTDKAYISGSYNWTSSATTINDEVLEVGTDPEIRDRYKQIVEHLISSYTPH